jgi:hypothetical protein
MYSEEYMHIIKMYEYIYDGLDMCCNAFFNVKPYTQRYIYMHGAIHIALVTALFCSGTISSI